jgi:aspartate racemase
MLRRSAPLTNTDLVLGVIGGMGPQATADFLAKLVAVTPVGVEQEHLRVLIDSNPAVPDRNKAIAGNGVSPAPALEKMAVGLETAGADMLVMICNTAHVFEGAIRRAVTVPFVSIVDEACDACARVVPVGQHVGLLAAPGCIEAGLYQEALQRRRLKPVLLSPEDQASFNKLIYEIKLGAPTNGIAPQMKRLADRLVASGAQALVAACTEVPLALSQQDLSRPLIDATRTLAERCVRYARRLEPIPLSYYRR